MGKISIFSWTISLKPLIHTTLWWPSHNVDCQVLQTNPIGIILAMEWSKKLSASRLSRITFLQLRGNCNQALRFLHFCASRRISISHTRLITHAAFIPLERWWGRTTHSAVHITARVSTALGLRRNVKRGIWKEHKAVRIKAGFWEGTLYGEYHRDLLRKSGGYPPTDWLHLHRHCLFMWQMGPINFIAGLTVIKLTKLAGPGASRYSKGSMAANHERQMGVIFLFFFLVANAQCRYFPCLS